MKKKIKKILYYMVLVFALFFFAFAVIFAVRSANGEDNVYFFGFKPYVIISGSMEPTIKTYGFVLVQQTDISEIQKGDIISFKYEKADVCHRVIDVSENGLSTKGDNSKAADGFYTTSDNFNGKVIFYSNILADYINFYNERGIFVAAVLPAMAIVIVIIALHLLRRSFKNSRKEKENKRRNKESKLFGDSKKDSEIKKAEKEGQ